MVECPTAEQLHQSFDGKCDKGVEHAFILASGRCDIELHLRQPLAHRVELPREIGAQVPATPEEQRNDADSVDALLGHAKCRLREIGFAEFEEGQRYARVRHAPLYFGAQAFERLRPAHVACAMRKENEPAVHGMGDAAPHVQARL